MTILYFAPRVHKRRPRAFRPRLRPETGICGLYWLQPVELQLERARALHAAGFEHEQVSTLTHIPLRSIQSLLDVAEGPTRGRC